MGRKVVPSEEYKEILKKSKKFLVYNYKNKDEWGKFRAEFQASEISNDEKIQCLVDASTDITNYERYAKLAFSLIAGCQDSAELKRRINALKINHLASKIKYSKKSSYSLIQHFYSPLLKHLKKLSFPDQEIIQVLTFSEKNLCVTQILLKHASKDDDIWSDLLEIVKNAPRKDAATSHNVLKLLQMNYNGFNISNQFRSHAGLMLQYIAVLRRLLKLNIDSTDISNLVVAKGKDGLIFADNVFDQNNDHVKKRYLNLLRQLDIIRDDDFDYRLFIKLLGFDINRVKDYDDENVAHDIAIIDELIRLNFSKKLIHDFLKHRRDAAGLTIVEYTFVHGYEDSRYDDGGFIELFHQLMNRLISLDLNASELLEIFNPSLVSKQCSGNKDKTQYLFNYYDQLLDLDAGAELAEEACTILVNADLDTRKQLSGINARYPYMQRRSFVEKLVTLNQKGLSTKNIHSVLSLKYGTDGKYNGLSFCDYCIYDKWDNAGEILFILQQHDLIPPADHGKEIRDKVFDYIHTLPDAEKKEAYENIKDRSHPLAKLFWNQTTIAFWKKPALPKKISKKIAEEMPSIVSAPLVGDATDTNADTNASEVTYVPLETSDNPDHQRTSTNGYELLRPVYIPASEAQRNYLNAFDELENLKPIKKSPLVVSGLHAIKSKESNQDQPPASKARIPIPGNASAL